MLRRSDICNFLILISNVGVIPSYVALDNSRRKLLKRGLLNGMHGILVLHGFGRFRPKSKRLKGRIVELPSRKIMDVLASFFSAVKTIVISVGVPGRQDPLAGPSRLGLQLGNRW